MSAKRIFSILLPVMLLLAISRTEGAEPAGRFVHVSGVGTVTVVPNEVVIDMTITTVDDDLVRVRKDSDDQARTVLTLAKKHGVTEDHFVVSRLELTLDYSDQLRRQIYHVERDIEIRLRQLANLDGLLSGLLGVPDSEVTAITFDTAEAREHRLEALRRAVADAREKAQLLARLNNLTLGKASDIRVVTESESPSVISVIPVVGSRDGGNEAASTAANVACETRGPGRVLKGSPPMHFIAFQESGEQPPQRAKEAKQTAPFAVGVIEVTASVNIDFELAE